MSDPIDFYFDFISPYGYLASTKVEEIAARHGREVTWRPFLMGVPIIKIMGLKPLMETPLKSDYTLIDIFRLATWLQAPLSSPNPKATNSRAAARAFYWIHDQSPEIAVRFAKAVYERMWVDGQDISDPAVVVAEAAKLGLPGDDLIAALGSEQLKARLEAEVTAAVARGVFGSPFIIADGEPFWGVDRLPLLNAWLSPPGSAPAFI